MSAIIYAEGYSEENMVKHLLWNIGSRFSNDASEITSPDIIYLKNCEGDGGIFPSITEDSHLIQMIPTKRVIIIQDILDSVCYSVFKRQAEQHLLESNIINDLRIVNSRPLIEHHYLEEMTILRSVILGYINQRKGTHNPNYNTIDPHNDLDSTNYGSIKKVLSKNSVGMSKKDFSDKYFGSLINRGQTITILTRLRSFLP